jgi:hypothetical protein
MKKPNTFKPLTVVSIETNCKTEGLITLAIANDQVYAVTFDNSEGSFMGVRVDMPCSTTDLRLQFGDDYAEEIDVDIPVHTLNCITPITIFAKFGDLHPSNISIHWLEKITYHTA